MLALLVAIITSFARTHSLGNNVSFTSVRLLWTLAEVLCRQQSSSAIGTADGEASKPTLHSNKMRPARLNSTPLIFGVEVPEIFFTSVASYSVPLQVFPPSFDFPSSEAEKGEDLMPVVLQIFDQLRKLSTDSRIEVRNCSLRSLVAACSAATGAVTTTTTPMAQRATLPDNNELVTRRVDGAAAFGSATLRCEDIAVVEGEATARMGKRTLADDVSLILVDALKDVSATYRTLMRDAMEVVDDQQQGPNGKGEQVVASGDHGHALAHHSRDSALKLWDDSVVIAVRGVAKIVTGMTKKYEGSGCSSDGGKFQSGESIVLRRAACALCELLELVLTASLSRKAEADGDEPVISCEGKRSNYL